MTLNNQMKISFLSLGENVGIARITAASFAAQVDLPLSEIEEINWFNFDMTEEEIADKLWELFDYNFGEENGKEF